jgi:peptide/nickel transport system permease protein
MLLLFRTLRPISAYSRQNTAMRLFRSKKTMLSGGSVNQLAWQRLRRNPTALLAFGIIGLALLGGILGYAITPDPSPMANRQHLEISLKQPGFQTHILQIRKKTTQSTTPWYRGMWQGFPELYQHIPLDTFYIKGDSLYYRVLSSLPGAPAEGILLPEVFLPVKEITKSSETEWEALLMDGRELVITDPQISAAIKSNVKEKRFILGTDRFGRDMLSRLIIGARVSLSVGFIAVFISLLIGISLGAMAGYFRGWIDDLILWLINVVWSIPTLLLVIAITFALGKGFWQVFVAVGLTMWVEVARVVRGQVLSIREKEFVEAGRALGYGHFRIITKHILPNVMAPVIVISAANFASAILIEAGLSFLGIGVQPPMPSWGSMIRENYAYIILDKAYLAILPGTCIMLLVLAFMLLGNALRDALDVRTQTIS